MKYCSDQERSSIENDSFTLIISLLKGENHRKVVADSVWVKTQSHERSSWFYVAISFVFYEEKLWVVDAAFCGGEVDAVADKEVVYGLPKAFVAV